jgi:Zn-dependent protease
VGPGPIGPGPSDGGRGGNGSGAGRRGWSQGRGSTWAQDPRRTLWILGIVAVVALLFSAHRINGDEVIFFCVIIPSLILHEIAHGWVANLCGDDTAKRAGRLSLNPIRHIDPVGTLILPAIMMVSTGFLFGWAKPVPVDNRRLRSPRNQGVLVALAGPFANLLLVGVAALVFRTVYAHTLYTLGTTPSVLLRVFYYAGLGNLILAFYNLVPLPPLDGSVLIERLLPARWWPGYLRVRQHMLPALIVLFLLLIWINVGGESLATHLFNGIQTLWVNIIG